ncbi:MAG: hypothetical protein KY468_19475 [Armatimonadetes bacterium]|nr:hypothetical protein [Armatimonadota bacterium]
MSDLPVPSDVKPPSEIDPWDLWHDVVVEVKKRFMQPSFWQALETVIPITIEGTTFVAGLPAAAGHYSGYLTGTENRNRLERILQELANAKLTLRIIEGTEESDWEFVKQREQAAHTAQQAMRTRFEQPSAPGAGGRPLTWESLLERIYAMFSRAKGHNLPQGRVEYLMQILPILSEQSQKIMDASRHDLDRNERALARLIDKIAGLVEVPSAVIALELYRYRQDEKKKTES